MTGVIATIPRIQFSNSLGLPLAGGKLTTYLAGTTTPAVTYQDQALEIANPTTITLDSTGSCVLWLDPEKSYKFLLKNALGVTQPGWPVDNISGASTPATLSTLFAKSADLAKSTGSGLIGWIRSAAGALATTLQKWLDSQEMCVFEFMSDEQIASVRARNLAVDVTVPLKAAHAAAGAAQVPLRYPRGWYRVSDSLTLYPGSPVRGSNWFPSDWRVPAIASTKVKLVSAAVKDLFVADQAALDQGYVWGIHLGNITLEGSDVTGTRGMFLQKVASSVFENIGISRFWRGVEIEYGMLNTYNRVNSSKCTEASFYLNGDDVTTTQVFNDCVARESPWGWIGESTPAGNSFGTVFNNCGLESLTQGGISMHRCCGFEWRGGYAENVPDDRVTKNGAIFHLWMDGDATVDPYRSVGVLDGGDLGGGNFDSFTDSAIVEVGAAKSLVVSGSSMKRATKGIRWDATAADGAIQLDAPNMVQIATPYFGPDGKMQGIYPEAILTSGATRLLARFWSMFLAGGQLRFPAVQNPSDDPNTLDDYKEGDWVGALTPAGGTITMGGFKNGYYTKVGRMVTATGLFVPSAVAAPTGILKLTGLPFPVRAGGGGHAAANVSVRYMTGVATAMSVDAVAQAGTSYIEIMGFNNGNPVDLSSHIQAGTEVRIGLTYPTN